MNPEEFEVSEKNSAAFSATQDVVNFARRPEKTGKYVPNDEAIQRQVEEVVDPVIDLVKNSQDYSDLKKSLLETFPEMKTKKIEETLRKAFILSKGEGYATGE